MGDEDGSKSLHSFALQGFLEGKMRYLQLPEKAPDYRRARPHDEFLCRLKDLVPTPDVFWDALTAQLGSRFEIVPCELDDGEVAAALAAKHYKATRTVDNEEG